MLFLAEVKDLSLLCKLSITIKRNQHKEEYTATRTFTAFSVPNSFKSSNFITWEPKEDVTIRDM